MIDSITRKPLEVDPDGFFGPCIEVPTDQLAKVTNLLEENKVSYWVDEEFLSMDGKPEVGFVNLAKQTDHLMVQSLLDRIS